MWESAMRGETGGQDKTCGCTARPAPLPRPGHPLFSCARRRVAQMQHQHARVHTHTHTHPPTRAHTRKHPLGWQARTLPCCRGTPPLAATPRTPLPWPVFPPQGRKAGAEGELHNRRILRVPTPRHAHRNRLGLQRQVHGDQARSNRCAGALLLKYKSRLPTDVA